jgi:hypothetical protein
LQRFLIEGSIGETLLTKIKSTSSGPEEQWGCTLSDFLNYTSLGAPEQAGSEPRKIAAVMAAEQIKQDNIDEILGEIPEAMLIDFTKAVVVSWAQWMAQAKEAAMFIASTAVANSKRH